MDEQRKQFPETQPTPGADAVKTVKVDFLLIVLLIRLLVLGCAGLHCPGGFSPVSMGRGCPLAAVCRPPAQRLQQRAGSGAHGPQRFGLPGSGAQAQDLWSTGLVCPLARGVIPSVHGIFPDPGSSPCLLHWQVDSLPLSHQGSSIWTVFS